jgi:hypothetical protein
MALTPIVMARKILLNTRFFSPKQPRAALEVNSYERLPPVPLGVDLRPGVAVLSDCTGHGCGRGGCQCRLAGRYVLPETTSFESGPVILGDTLYIPTATGTYALNAIDGKLNWSHHLHLFAAGNSSAF